MHKVILFDLDGTLTESGEGITKSVQYALEKMGKPQDDTEKLRVFIGPPLLEQFMKYAGFDKNEAKMAVQYYRERYAVTGIFENRLYPGIEEMLKELKQRGCLLAVASSKPEQYVIQILEYFGLKEYFDEIVGATMGEKRTGKAEVIAEALRRLHMEEKRSQVLMVGDKEQDVNGARKEGIACIAVSYGYGTREELEAARPARIAATVEELKAILMPRVSIIVPVYNAEKTLSRCVDSILNQTYKEFELILVDDGSTDASGAICDEYAGKDVRIHVIHKENSGVSDSRNQGIAEAGGEYLQFLDSDDWISPDATALFVRTAEEQQCDMVIADFYRVKGERVSQKGAIEEAGLMDKAGYAANMMQRPADFYYGVLWNKLYKRSVIEKYRLKMDCDISWCEDFIFNLEYIRHIQTIYALKVPVYYYVKTKGSLVSQGMSMKKMIRMKRTVFAHYNRFYKEVFGEEAYEKRRLQIYRFLIDSAGDGEVAPGILPGNYKLGDERTSVSEGVQEGEGFFFDIYRERKLQEMLFDTVALKNDLATNDVKLLYYLSEPHENCTSREVTSILNIARGELTKTIQRLLGKELIEVKARPREKERSRSREKPQQGRRRDYSITPEAEVILSEILFVLNDLEQIQYEGFSQEEIELYERLNEKRNQNIRRALR